MWNQTWQELLRFMKLSHSLTSLTMALACLDCSHFWWHVSMDSFICRGRRGCHIHIPALHFTQLAQQIAILDCRSTTSICPLCLSPAANFPMTSKSFLIPRMEKWPSKSFAKALCVWGFSQHHVRFPSMHCELDTFKTLLPRTEGASTCFGRDLHYACQSLRKMTGGRQEPIRVHDCRSRNSTNHTHKHYKNSAKTCYCYMLCYFHFGHVQETGINHPHTPGPRWQVARCARMQTWSWRSPSLRSFCQILALLFYA